MHHGVLLLYKYLFFTASSDFCSSIESEGQSVVNAAIITAEFWHSHCPTSRVAVWIIQLILGIIFLLQMSIKW